MNEKLYNELLIGLVKFLNRSLPQIHKNWWDELVVPYLNNNEYNASNEYDLTTLDLKALINVFRANYKEFYERKKFINWSPFYLSGVIKTIRNEKAHSNLQKIRTSEEVILDVISSKIFLNNLDQNSFEKNLEFQGILNAEIEKQFERYRNANNIEVADTKSNKEMEGNDINLEKISKIINTTINDKLNTFTINAEESSNANINENYQIERVEKLILELQNNLNNNYEKIKNLFDPQKIKNDLDTSKINKEDLAITNKIDENSIMDILERNTTNISRSINYNTAKDLLLGLREIINEENPEIKDEHNVLRTSMIHNFLTNKITNNDLYFEKISPEMHNLTNRKSLQYLPDIYSIIKRLK